MLAARSLPTSSVKSKKKVTKVNGYEMEKGVDNVRDAIGSHEST
jgi:hypothetical protein